MKPSVDSGVKAQYTDDRNLSARIRLHRLYSTNSEPWSSWVFRQMALPERGHILELGCGTGQLWLDNRAALPRDCQITLSDFSSGMLSVAKERVGELAGNFTFRLIDAQEIPLPDASVDMCIANHMLYHVPDVSRALSEIRRVLAPSGKLYATTVGEGHLAEIGEYLAAIDPKMDVSGNVLFKFSLQNGKEILSQYFTSIKRTDFEDSFKVTKVEDLVQYILSMPGISNVVSILKGEKLKQLEKTLQEELSSKGYIHVSKESGIFTAA